MDKYKILSIIKVGYGLMNKAERKKAFWLSFTIIIVAVIDMIAILGVMPLVSLIVEPDYFQKLNSSIVNIKYVESISREKLIVWFSSVAIVFLIISLVLNIITQYLLYNFGAKCSSRLARDMMDEALKVSYGWHLKQNTTVLTRMFFGDIQIWGGDFIHVLLVIMQKISIVILATMLVLMAAHINSLIVLLIIAFLVSSILVVIKPKVTKLASQQREKSDAIVISSNQCFCGIKDIKLSSRKTFFLNLYSNAFRSFSNARMLLAVWKHVPPTLLVFFGQIALILAAVVLWKNGLNTGEIAANMALFLLVSSRLIPAVNRVTGDVASLWSSFPYIERLAALKDSFSKYELVENNELNKDIKNVNWNFLKFNGISYRYETRSELALRDINFNFEFGKSYGVVGSSGSGKSTLINILLGLLKPSSGEICIDNKLLNDSNIYGWQKNISYVPQSPFIADVSLRSNVAFGIPEDEIDDERVWDCLEMANIKEFCENLDNKLDTPLGDEGGVLSGGQKQRIAIARALYDKPNLLVLDEATSALDSISEKSVQQEIKKLDKKVTVIIVAHRLSTIKDCDSILLLDKGTLIETGNYNYLIKECSLFKNMVSSSGVMSKGEVEVDEKNSISI